MWWVYVIQSLQGREGGKPGFYYVGATTDPRRRLRQHNGEISGGAKYTSKYRPWTPRALYGPYKNRSCAQKAEYALKKGKRAKGRTKWTTKDSPWCRGEGASHPWVTEGIWNPPDPESHVYPPEPKSSASSKVRRRRRSRRRSSGRRRSRRS